jgi:hypothetical protein
MAETKRVRFLQSRVVKDGSGQVFEEGVEYDLVPSSADRWISRNLAVEVTDAGDGKIVGGFMPAAEGDVRLPNFADPLEAKHLGFGKYDVLDANGVKVNTETLNKAAAEAVVEAGAAALNEAPAAE